MKRNSLHNKTKKRAIQFIVFFGAVSLFADVTYEGARSITGPFLELLGAGAAVVGLVIGLGELIGYGLRLFTGWWADRTGRYWLFIIAGYSVNLLAVPLIGFAETWQVAAAGFLYEINTAGMVLFLVITQLLAIPFLWKAFSTNR